MTSCEIAVKKKERGKLLSLSAKERDKDGGCLIKGSKGKRPKRKGNTQTCK